MRINIKPRKKKSFGIEKYNHQTKNLDMIKKMEDELSSIDKKIAEVISGLLQAQNVQIKSALNRDPNWLSTLQRKWVNSAALKSANWHQVSLINLYKQRNHLQRSLDKATGEYWPKKIKAFILVCTLVMLISLTFAITFYLAPLLIICLLIYILIKKKDN